MATSSSEETKDTAPGKPGVTFDGSANPPKRTRHRLFSAFLNSAISAAGEEILASYIAHDRGKDGSYYTSRVPKMVLYGAFIDTTLTRFLLKGLESLFMRERSTGKGLEIVVAMLIIIPIQRIVHIISIALIAGARTFHQFRASVNSVFLPTMAVIWFSAPVAIAFAQKFLPEPVWPPFFSFMSFVIDTYANSMLKKNRLAALRNKLYRNRTES